jgi:hypothetical protein
MSSIKRAGDPSAIPEIRKPSFRKPRIMVAGTFALAATLAFGGLTPAVAYAHEADATAAVATKDAPTEPADVVDDASGDEAAATEAEPEAVEEAEIEEPPPAEEEAPESEELPVAEAEDSAPVEVTAPQAVAYDSEAEADDDADYVEDYSDVDYDDDGWAFMEEYEYEPLNPDIYGGVLDPNPGGEPVTPVAPVETVRPVKTDRAAYDGVEASIVFPVEKDRGGTSRYVYDLETLSGDLIDTDEANPYGSVAFQIHYTEPGTYEYIVTEYAEQDDDYIETGHKTRVTVVVTEGEDGLVASYTAENLYAFDPSAAPAPAPAQEQTPAVQSDAADQKPASQPEKPDPTPAPPAPQQAVAQAGTAGKAPSDADNGSKPEQVSDATTEASTDAEKSVVPKTGDPASVSVFASLAAFGASLVAGAGYGLFRKRD